MGEEWTQPLAPHASMVHLSLSSQVDSVPRHWPWVHWAAAKHAELEVHEVPSVSALRSHPPVCGLNVTSWHAGGAAQSGTTSPFARTAICAVFAVRVPPAAPASSGR